MIDCVDEAVPMMDRSSLESSPLWGPVVIYRKPVRSTGCWAARGSATTEPKKHQQQKIEKKKGN